MTPTARLLVLAFALGFMVSMAFLIFGLSGGRLRPGFRSGLTNAQVVYDDPSLVEGPKPSIAPASPRVHPPAAWEVREPGAPETTAEELYYAAIRKEQEVSKRMAERQKPRDLVVEFAKSEAGKDLKEVSDLARRGRFAEAKPALARLLSGIVDADWRIQAYVLKMAINIYKQDHDSEGLKVALDQYLDAAKKYLGTRAAASAEGEKLEASQKDLDGLIHDVQRARESIK